MVELSLLNSKESSHKCEKTNNQATSDGNQDLRKPGSARSRLANYALGKDQNNPHFVFGNNSRTFFRICKKKAAPDEN